MWRGLQEWDAMVDGSRQLNGPAAGGSELRRGLRGGSSGAPLSHGGGGQRRGGRRSAVGSGSCTLINWRWPSEERRKDGARPVSQYSSRGGGDQS